MSIAPLVAEVVVPVTPTQAFVGFTAQMGEWWDPVLSPDAATFTSIAIDPNGPVATVHGDEQFVFGRVMTWDPIGHLVMEFWLGHAEDEATVLDVRFTDAPEGAMVRLVHSGWREGSEEVRAKYTHWDDLLRRFAAYVS
ncbi:SRPBCC domain-containing protein [Nocardioides hwasunensis]|uniref:SRPBCC domain-containing protein n=1 Tax=Nocardioides hwasunensis TaxID=397258 RepID=A0ABR8MFV6_9ACTN|nr:SRPBCC domain-containing protein [Nocardioides hwasunensis]MBD3913364.1 SRPBCC domain-containing protein [Nocardioides hwasunensis]